MAETVLATEGLTKRFGLTGRARTAVDGLSINVRAGEVYGFLGPNGAGKSTTIRMILGLIRPTKGGITLFGGSSRRARKRARSRIGAIVDTPAFYPFLSGIENLRVFARLSKPSVKTEELAEAARTVGLAGRERDKVRKYSHGMKQRLAIAAALTPRPELVVLDEPTNGLDPKGIKEIRELVRRLAHENGITVFLSSHILSEIEQVADRVGVIDRGRLITEGPLEELKLSVDDCVEVEIDNADSSAEALAKSLPEGTSFEQSEPDGVYRIKGDCDPAELNARLVSAGVRVRSIGRRRYTLEDVFLKLTAREDGESEVL